jgi:NADH-quinone oxidoreductase subunit M
VFQGEPDEANKSFPDLNISEKLVMVPLVALIIFLGVYPKPVLDRIEPSVKRVVERLEVQVDRFDEPTTRKGADLLRIPESSHSSGEHSLGVTVNGQGANQ